MGKRHIHDMCDSRLYRIWASMKSRCSCPTRDHYENYGGRGIRVCEDWNENFLSFYNWSMSNGYSDSLEIDRIDNDGDYEPNNCQWITHKENNNKRGNNRLITIAEKRRTLTEWAEIFGLTPETVISRLSRGWETSKAFTTPVNQTGRRMWKTQSISNQITRGGLDG